MKRALTFSLQVVIACSFVLGQTSRGGGAASGGLGKAFDAAGGSAAAESLQRKMNATLLNAIAKQRTARGGGGNSKGTKRPNSSAAAVTSRTATAITSETFRRSASIDVYGSLADSLGSTAEERSHFRELFRITKQEFEKEVAAKGRANNLPAALTFFIVVSLTVYHDSPEPSDEVVDTVWEAMSSALAENPEISQISDGDKQRLYDTLVAMCAILFAGYLEGKKPGNQDTAAIFRELAGSVFESVLKTDASSIRFGKQGLERVP